MKRTRYGNIEDIVLDTKLVTAGGRRAQPPPPAAQRPPRLCRVGSATGGTGAQGSGLGRHSKKVQTARYSHGPDVQQMLYGSERNFGVITSVVVKVHVR